MVFVKKEELKGSSGNVLHDSAHSLRDVWLSNAQSQNGASSGTLGFKITDVRSVGELLSEDFIHESEVPSKPEKLKLKLAPENHQSQIHSDVLPHPENQASRKVQNENLSESEHNQSPSVFQHHKGTPETEDCVQSPGRISSERLCFQTDTPLAPVKGKNCTRSDSQQYQGNDTPEMMDLIILNVVSLADSGSSFDKDSHGEPKVSHRQPSVIDEPVYDYHCIGTVSLVEKVGTNILEFVYDEVFVEIASNVKEDAVMGQEQYLQEKHSDESGSTGELGEKSKAEVQVGNNDNTTNRFDSETDSAVQSGEGNHKNSFVDNNRSVFDVMIGLVQDVTKENSSKRGENVENREAQIQKPAEIGRYSNETDQNNDTTAVVGSTVNSARSEREEKDCVMQHLTKRMHNLRNNVDVLMEQADSRDVDEVDDNDVYTVKSTVTKSNSNSLPEFTLNIETALNAMTSLEPKKQDLDVQTNFSFEPVLNRVEKDKESGISDQSDTDGVQMPVERSKLMKYTEHDKIPVNPTYHEESTEITQGDVRNDTSFDMTDPADEMMPCPKQSHDIPFMPFGSPDVLQEESDDYMDLYTQLNTTLPTEQVILDTGKQKGYRCQICDQVRSEKH